MHDPPQHEHAGQPLLPAIAVSDDQFSGDPVAIAAGAVAMAIDASVAERVTGAWTDLAFNSLAIQIFQAQYQQVAPYRAWCDYELGKRGVAAHEVARWHEVPALPIDAFKRFRVAAYGPQRDRATWHSSGTTRAGTSSHHLPDLGLYEASLLAAARVALVPDGLMLDRGLLALQLAPAGEELATSSLSHMFDAVRLRLCRDGGAWAHGAQSTVDVDGAWQRLEQAVVDDEPVLLLTTSFGLVQMLDGVADRSALELPAGSRLLDTGGYKGRTRELTRAELVDAAAERLGLDPAMCDNEYGMSELSSQAYVGSIAAHVGRPMPGCNDTPDTRWQPPWMRTRVVHPMTLEPVAEGETGLLVHHDLANAYSCAVIRSQDIGVRRRSSYELVGRAPGAELRGCSLRLEEVPS